MTPPNIRATHDFYMERRICESAKAARAQIPAKGTACRSPLLLARSRREVTT